MNSITIFRVLGLIAICFSSLCYSNEIVSNDSKLNLDDLFLHPEYEKLKIEYDIEWTLKARGTQKYKHIIKIDNGVWIKEMIAPAGVIFVTDQHLVQTVDLNKKEWEFKSLLHPIPDGLSEDLEEKQYPRFPINEETQNSLQFIAKSPITVSELFGLSEKIQVFYGDGEVSLQESSINNMNQGVYFNETLQQIVAIFSHDMMGRLKNATCITHSKPVTREIIYGDYKVQERASIICPETITMKTYSHVGIPERDESSLAEEAILTNIVVTTDF
ncbi:MAG: hypothetical protein P9L94_20590 [Candidatus Hinthialibacter antarcticus]|nr:hypothetical protein [Candidatus Hinthialibacter antarcticus]